MKDATSPLPVHNKLSGGNFLPIQMQTQMQHRVNVKRVFSFIFEQTINDLQQRVFSPSSTVSHRVRDISCLHPVRLCACVCVRVRGAHVGDACERPRVREASNLISSSSSKCGARPSPW